MTLVDCPSAYQPAD